MKTSIIFGITGQDGFYLREQLQQQGHHVIGIARSSGGDVADCQAVDALVRQFQPDYIFHLAANSTTRHEALFENHATLATGTLNILEAVKHHAPQCRVFITGSGVQFVNTGKPISENDAFAPLSAYAVARIHAVYAARYYRSLGIKAYVGYLFHHESPLRKPNHLCKKIAEIAKRVKAGSQEYLTLGDPSVRKEVGFAGDIVAGIWTLVNQENHFEATIGTGKAYSIQEWIETCFAHVQCDWRSAIRVHADGFVPEYPILVSDPTTIFALGWKPTVDIEALAEMMLS